MEQVVIFRDRQELQSADLNNMQDFTRASVDHVVKDAIDGGKAYAGFTASKTAATEITLSAGRLYAGGEVYARDENVVIDLFNLLPLVTKKRVATIPAATLDPPHGAASPAVPALYGSGSPC